MSQLRYKRRLLVPFLKIVGDSLAVFLAVITAYTIRFNPPFSKIIPVTKGIPPFINYVYFSLFLSLMFIVLFGIFNSYRSRYFSTFSQDITIVLKTSALGILLAMSAAFLYRGFSYSRMVFLLIFITVVIYLLIERFIFHRIKNYFLRRGYNVLKVCLVSSADVLTGLAVRFQADPNSYFSLKGYVAAAPEPNLKIKYEGSFAQLPSLLQEEVYDGLVLALQENDHGKLPEIMKATEGKNIEIFYIPDILDLLTSNVNSLEVAGVPLLQLKSFSLSGWQGLIKRAFDIAVALTGLILLSPFMLLLAAVVKLSSSGPVFYKQWRVGMEGKEFKMIKFRSMYADAETQTGPVWTKEKDPRVTPIGKFLRRTSLDELPQLFNVLRGQMSLVGPRPERKFFVEKFQKMVPHYRERHRVRCGMTGWAQVNGLRGQSPIEERTRYDLYYIEHWSLWLDIKIIILTVMAIIKGENAY